MQPLDVGIVPVVSRLKSWVNVAWARLTVRDLRWLLVPISAFLVTRLIILACAYLSSVALPPPTGGSFWHAVPNNLLLDVWARWDSGYYLDIAQKGYKFVSDQQSSVPFFPLLPLLTN